MIPRPNHVLRPLALISRSSALRPLPLVKVAKRGFQSSPSKTNSATVVGETPKTSPVNAFPPKFDASYLRDFSFSELFSFLVIGTATLNKSLLKASIKLFPYVPIPVIKALVYKIYCGGETITDVKQTGQKLTARGINNMMISLTIEACNGNDNIDPQYIVEETQKSIEEILIPHTLSVIETSGKDINSIPAGYVALKPTGFVKNAAAVLKNYKSEEYKKDFEDLVSKASQICKSVFEANKRLAAQYPERVSPFVVSVIDAEKHDLQEGVYELQRRLYKAFNPVGSPVSVVGTLQMYLSESSNLLALEEKMARENNYRLGLKLVRGAYIHSEQDRSTIIHKTKEDTDTNYNRGISYCIDSILSSESNKSVIGHLVVASHNADSLRLASEKTYKSINSVNNANKSNICLGQLMGMADAITYDLINNEKIDNVIKYVPWGPPLETKEYLLRRLEENGDAVKNDNGLPLIKAVGAEMMKRLVA
ncbi:putative proline dehydrogenase [Clavispora lusitaniae]|uniref:Proline dehydrogenase n=2 Tax=Clavispora lusitaniae TaxID=36911 RepID=C4Y0B7_CLAL4|nr:uncharacterized protein CLUG_01649 [Clavispora lusitaniae ATCC 42720]KAF5212109.1 hypothetical protein E0198_001665 [Clavispora lusitaniae]EEQ37526.1 hypothetical protein CLUG_01649 [Clavispora lusitaniae ATCC 42720]QFZ26530.1 putative proline dehydrogenase [Clavispora lusitaniae]QFZ32198.1 putative proline dehydrogenase [Clavispora lusitaniae]QFZ37867.1 putative proline dehydrogenase [Clavispora lusitaniae]